MTVTLTTAPTWTDVFLSIAVLPASALALFFASFLIRETWKVATGFYERKGN